MTDFFLTFVLYFFFFIIHYYYFMGEKGVLRFVTIVAEYIIVVIDDIKQS